MKNFILITMMFTVFLSGCGRIRHRNLEQNYSGFPRQHESHSQFSNTSLCKTTDDILYCKPCAMQTLVSQDFMRGYNDGLANKRLKVFGKNDDYQLGFEAAVKDKQDKITRNFVVKQ